MPSCRNKAVTAGVSIMLVLCVGSLTIEILQYVEQSRKNDIIHGNLPFPNVSNSKFDPQDRKLDLHHLSKNTTDAIYLFFTRDLSLDKVYMSFMVLYIFTTSIIYSMYMVQIRFCQYYLCCNKSVDKDEVIERESRKLFPRLLGAYFFVAAIIIFIFAILLLNVPGDIRLQKEILSKIKEDLEESSRKHVVPSIHQLKDIAVTCVTHSYLYPLVKNALTSENDPDQRMMSPEEHDHFFEDSTEFSSSKNVATMNHTEHAIKEFDSFKKLGFCPRETYRLVAGISTFLISLMCIYVCPLFCFGCCCEKWFDEDEDDSAHKNMRSTSSNVDDNDIGSVIRTNGMPTQERKSGIFAPTYPPRRSTDDDFEEQLGEDSFHSFQSFNNGPNSGPGPYYTPALREGDKRRWT